MAVTLNRPKALNALSSALFTELNAALSAYDADSSIGAIIITGSDKAFAAGADIKEMASLTFAEAYKSNFIAPWSHLATSIRKPVIAAVSGYALGGGCELAMMCDIIYCTAGATFGQPEIKLGVIPGAGGSQRLTKAVGKSKAMEIILTGNNFSGKEAGEWGLAAKVVEGGNQEVVDLAVKTAEKIASYSRVAVIAGKEVVDKSQELSLKEGVEFERRMFHALFGSQDQKIGKSHDTRSRTYADMTQAWRHLRRRRKQSGRMNRCRSIIHDDHSHNISYLANDQTVNSNH